MIEKPEPIEWLRPLVELESQGHCLVAQIEALRAIAEKLNVLEKYVSLFVETNVVVSSELLPRESASYVVPASGMAKLHKALNLVRDILDASPPPASPGEPWGGGELWTVEALLSAELGNPIWEGGRK